MKKLLSHLDAHVTEKEKKITSNQLFSNFFSKTVTFFREIIAKNVLE